jgi:hypothetical protein
MTPTSFPLHWPASWPRTKYPGSSQFRTALNGAIKNVKTSLKAFATDSGKKMENVLVSSNYTLSDQSPADSGVAVYFTWDDISTCIAVDKYRDIEDNLQAIHHCIEAERTKLRHGGLNLVRAAFRGYAALPPPTADNPATNARDWWVVLGVSKLSKRADIEAAYRTKAKECHPDTNTTGSQAAMTELNIARDHAIKGFSA